MKPVPVSLTLQDIASLIHDTAALYVGTPAEVKVVFREAEDGVLFTIKGNPQDDGRLIGRDAEHIHALGRLVRYAGKKMGREFGVKLLTERRLDGPMVRTVKTLSYDSTPIHLVIIRWLRAFGDPFPTASATIRQETMDTLEFDMEAKVSPGIAGQLVGAVEEISGLTPIDSLGILIKAMGKQAGGVRLRFKLTF